MTLDRARRAGRAQRGGRALTAGAAALALTLMALPGTADAETASPTASASGAPVGATARTPGDAGSTASSASGTAGPGETMTTTPSAAVDPSATADPSATGSADPSAAGSAEPSGSVTPTSASTQAASAVPTTAVTPTPTAAVTPTAAPTETPDVQAADAPVPQPIVLDRVISRLDSLKNPTFTGSIAPVQSGVLIHIDVYTGGRFRGKASTTTDANGRFSVSFGYGSGSLATYTVRAAALPAGVARWSVTPSQTFTRTAVINAVVSAVTADDVTYTYRAGCPVGPSKLRTVTMNFYGFDHKMHRGLIIIRSDLTDDLIRGFGKALDHRYPVRKMDNPDVYRGSDPVQMEADNSSGFNCRKVTGNPYAQSPHSYGIALDVNTVENPYRDVTGKWWPKNGRPYIKRSPRQPGMLIKDSYLTSSLRNDDFFWGGLWYPGRDYQHFEYRP